MRYELKYIIRETELPCVLAWTRIHFEGFKETYPSRTVNSIYFDKLNLTDFSDNLAGTGIRNKLRLRWYGDFEKSVTAMLEQKKKKFNSIDKHIIDLGEFNLDRYWVSIIKDINNDIPLSWTNYWQRVIHPTIITRYKRAYFATRDEAIRLTIDTELKTFNQRRHLMPQVDFANLSSSLVVVELKAPLHEVRRLQLITSTFPARRERFSKYVEGLSSDFI